MSQSEQPGKGWLLHGGLLFAGGLIGAVALAAAVLAILTAIAANFMIWLLVIPMGGRRLESLDGHRPGVSGGRASASAYAAFLVVRALWRFFRRRVMERNDGVQV